MVERVNTGHFSAIAPAIRQVKREHPGDYSEVIWGTKDSQHLKNLGFVIGYRDPTKAQSFRVDYDPALRKGLHINWEQDVVRSSGSKARIKECYLITPHILNPEDELYTWWRSTTLHHCNELPDTVRDRMDGKHVWRGSYWT